MTERSNRMRMSAAGATVLVALALSGCAGSHVGDAWQCPLAQGKVCASVTAADPAVTGAGEPGGLATASPLYRPQEGAAAAENTAPRETGPSKDRNCDAGCNPLGWLASLFTTGDDGTERESGTAAFESQEPAPATAPPSLAANEQDVRDSTEATPIADSGAIMAHGRHDAAASSLAAHGDSPSDTLRTPETIGRVWIAPFVDAGGVYREASWVRIVIAPAAWRLP